MARTSKRTKRRLQTWSIVAALAILILAVRLVEDIGYDQKPTDRFTVAAIIDGDTMELAGGDRLRLLSLDTPEKDEPYYREATAFLMEAAMGKTVRIEFAQTRRDRYGRLLGYVYIDTILLNEAILENGLGNLYLFADTDLDRPETGRMLAAQRRAIAAGRGIWSIARHPEESYIARDNSFRFHRPGCTSVEQLKEGRYRVFSTREEPLLEGLSPCRNCKP